MGVGLVAARHVSIQSRGGKALLTWHLPWESEPLIGPEGFLTPQGPSWSVDPRETHV